MPHGIWRALGDRDHQAVGKRPLDGRRLDPRQLLDPVPRGCNVETELRAGLVEPERAEDIAVERMAMAGHLHLLDAEPDRARQPVGIEAAVAGAWQLLEPGREREHQGRRGNAGDGEQPATRRARPGTTARARPARPSHLHV